jgi:hypothetical protein
VCVRSIQLLVFVVVVVLFEVVDAKASVSPCSSSRAPPSSVKIHFIGYKKSHQRWVDVEGDVPVLPAFTHTPSQPARPNASKASRDSKKSAEAPAGGAPSASVAPQAEAKAPVATTTNRYGRAVPVAFVPAPKTSRTRGREGETEGDEAKNDYKPEDDLNDWCALQLPSP